MLDDDCKGGFFGMYESTRCDRDATIKDNILSRFSVEITSKTFTINIISW